MSTADRTLRRLLRKPAARRLLDEETARLGPGHALADAGRQVLVGEAAALSSAAIPVSLDGRTIGFAHGPQGERLAALVGALGEMDGETRALAHESLQRYRELTMLYEVSERIISAPDPEAVSAMLCEEARRFLDCDTTAVLLLNSETGRLEVAAGVGSAFHSRASLPVGDDLVGTVLETGNGEIVNDLQADRRALDADNALRSVVCSALRSKDSVLGVVIAGTESPRHFNAGDLQMLNAMAGQAATAIQVARLDRELKEGSNKPADLIFGIDDRPPFAISLVVALQHVFIAVMSLAYPVLVTLEADGSRMDAASVVSMSLIAMALATALQVRRIGPLGAGFLAPHITSAIYLGPSLLAARVGGLSLVFGMTMMAGFVGLFLGPLLRRFRKLFPTEISGVVVLMVGISMVPVGLTRIVGLGGADTQSTPAECTVGLITLGSIVMLTIAPLGRVRLYSAAIGIALGYAAAFLLGVSDSGEYGALGDLPLLGLHALPGAAPDFSVLLFMPFLAAALASGVKDAGLVISCQKANDARWKRPDTRSVSGGLTTAGAGNLVSGLLGGAGLGISAGSVGLASASGATARVLGYYVAALMLALAFMPKLTAAVALMPSPVMGAGLVYVACHLITSGTGLIASRMLDARRTYIIGLSVVAGIGSLAIPELLADAPEWAEAIFGNPLALSTTVAVTLNLVLGIGVASRAHHEVRLDARLRDAVSRFVDKQGAAWGARSDVIRRAAPAVIEWCEEAVAQSGASRAHIDLDFDEFHLLITVTPVDPAPGSEGEAPAGAGRIAAGRLARRYDCTVEPSGSGSVSMRFEH